MFLTYNEIVDYYLEAEEYYEKNGYYDYEPFIEKLDIPDGILYELSKHYLWIIREAVAKRQLLDSAIVIALSNDDNINVLKAIYSRQYLPPIVFNNIVNQPNEIKKQFLSINRPNYIVEKILDNSDDDMIDYLVGYKYLPSACIDKIIEIKNIETIKGNCSKYTPLLFKKTLSENSQSILNKKLPSKSIIDYLDLISTDDYVIRNTPDILYRLSYHPNEDVRCKVANMAYVYGRETDIVYTHLASDSSVEVRQKVAEYIDTNSLVTLKLYNDENLYVYETLLLRDNLNHKYIDMAINDKNIDKRRTIAFNRNLRKSHLDKLINDENSDVVAIIANRDDLSQEHIDKLIKTNDPIVYDFLFGRHGDKVDRKTRLKLLKSDDFRIRASLTYTARLDKDILLKLSKDEHPAVRGAVINRDHYYDVCYVGDIKAENITMISTIVRNRLLVDEEARNHSNLKYEDEDE